MTWNSALLKGYSAISTCSSWEVLDDVKNKNTDGKTTFKQAKSCLLAALADLKQQIGTFKTHVLSVVRQVRKAAVQGKKDGDEAQQIAAPATPAASVPKEKSAPGGLFTYTMGLVDNPVPAWNKDGSTHPMVYEDATLTKQLEDLLEKKENKYRNEFLLRRAEEASKDTKGGRVTNQRPSIVLPAAGLDDLLQDLAPTIARVDTKNLDMVDELIKGNVQTPAAWAMTARATRFGSETNELAT